MTRVLESSPSAHSRNQNAVSTAEATAIIGSGPVTNPRRKATERSDPRNRHLGVVLKVLPDNALDAGARETHRNCIIAAWTGRKGGEVAMEVLVSLNAT